MTTKSSAGFTIIEVMLFLAIAGVLTVALLAGSGVAIGQQRYRDSVSSLKSLMQEQYSQVVNVANDRAGSTSSCANATVAETGTQARGSSNCIVLGRLLTIATDGKTITTQSVVGQPKSNQPAQPTDLAELQTNYNFGLSPLDKEETTVTWDARVTNPKAVSGAFKGLSLLVVRSPLSGSILTFAADGVTASASGVTQLVKNSFLKANKDVCVDARSVTPTGPSLAVRIDAYAANQSAVEIPLGSEGVCG